MWQLPPPLLASFSNAEDATRKRKKKKIQNKLAAKWREFISYKYYIIISKEYINIHLYTKNERQTARAALYKLYRQTDVWARQL